MKYLFIFLAVLCLFGCQKKDADDVLKQLNSCEHQYTERERSDLKSLGFTNSELCEGILEKEITLRMIEKLKRVP